MHPDLVKSRGRKPETTRNNPKTPAKPIDKSFGVWTPTFGKHVEDDKHRFWHLLAKKGSSRNLRQPEIFRNAGVWRTEYESYGPEVWEKE